MAREIRAKGVGEYRLWFGIEKSKIRFSKRVFCLVTGLKFDCLSNVINKKYEAVDGGIHNIYFNKNSDLFMSSIHDAFKIVKFNDKKDALKMAFVLFVEQILMDQDYRHKVSIWLLRLVEDTKEFNQFAWGEYFSRMSIHYISQGFHDASEGKIIARYNIYDFPWGLQVCIKPFCTYCCLF